MILSRIVSQLRHPALHTPATLGTSNAFSVSRRDTCATYYLEWTALSNASKQRSLSTLCCASYHQFKQLYPEAPVMLYSYTACRWCSKPAHCQLPCSNSLPTDATPPSCFTPLILTCYPLMAHTSKAVTSASGVCLANGLTTRAGCTVCTSAPLSLSNCHTLMRVLDTPASSVPTANRCRSPEVVRRKATLWLNAGSCGAHLGWCKEAEEPRGRVYVQGVCTRVQNGGTSCAGYTKKSLDKEKVKQRKRALKWISSNVESGHTRERRTKKKGISTSRRLWEAAASPPRAGIGSWLRETQLREKAV